MLPARHAAFCVVVAVGLGGCAAEPESARTSPPVVVESAKTPDSIPEERPDTVKLAPPDSTTMRLALLPAPPGTPLDGESAGMADRAVFAPRTQRWFMARTLDSALAMDIGRIDGGVGTTEVARAAFQRMVSARSPLQTGMPVTVHTHSGASTATVIDIRLTGRRIVATLGPSPLDSIERVVPVEWRGNPPVPPPPAKQAACAPGDSAAIAAAIARFPAAVKEAVSTVRGCFGEFRALITIRPLEITPETVERVVLVRANGTTRSGRLRDLSYPLHELRSVLDVDGDGTHEIVVRSFRMSMDTWSALRMTDSITFTRFSNGFTSEYR
jgi:hypothetical protein